MSQSNWASLKKKLAPSASSSSSSSSSQKRSSTGPASTREVDRSGGEKKKLKRTDINDTLQQQRQQQEVQRSDEHKYSRIDKSKYVGLDCEMVGTGEDGKVMMIPLLHFSPLHFTSLQ